MTLPVPLILGRNMTSLVLTNDPTDRATSIVGKFDQLAGKGTFLGAARFKVTAVNSGAKTVVLEDPAGIAGPVQVADQTKDWYFLREKTAETAKIDAAAKTSDTQTTLTLHAWLTGLSTGEYMQFRVTEPGIGLHSSGAGLQPWRLQHPGYLADIGVKERILNRADLLAVSQLIPNAVMRAWSDPDALPDGWEMVVGDLLEPVTTNPFGATFAQNTDPIFRQFGSPYSLYFEALLGPLTLITPPVPWTPVSLGQSMSLRARFRMTEWAAHPSFLITMRLGIKFASGRVTALYGTRSNTTVAQWFDDKKSNRAEPPTGTRATAFFTVLPEGIFDDLVTHGIDITVPSSQVNDRNVNQDEIDAMGDALGLVVILELVGKGYLAGVTMTPTLEAVPKEKMSEFGEANTGWQAVQQALALSAKRQRRFAVELDDLKRKDPTLDEQQLDKGVQVIITDGVDVIREPERITECRRDEIERGKTQIIVGSREKDLLDLLFKSSQRTDSAISSVAATVASGSGAIAPPSGGGNPVSPGVQRDDIPLLFLDGGDHGRNFSDWAYSDNTRLRYSYTKGRAGGGCYRTVVNGSNTWKVDNDTTEQLQDIAVAISINLNGQTIPSDGLILWQFMEYWSDAVQACIVVNASRQIEVWRGDSGVDVQLGGASVFALPATGWGHLEVIVRSDPVGGRVIVRYTPSGSLVSTIIYDSGAVNTQSDNASLNQIGQFALGSASRMDTVGASGGVADVLIDDIAIFNRTSIEVDAYTGYARVGARMPNAIGTYTSVPAPYQFVNGLEAGGGVRTVYLNTVGQKISFTLASASNVGTVLAVAPFWAYGGGFFPSSSTVKAKTIIRSASTDVESIEYFPNAPQNCNSSMKGPYNGEPKLPITPTDPATGALWTAAAFDAMEVGIHLTACTAGRTAGFSHLGVQFLYRPTSVGALAGEGMGQAAGARIDSAPVPIFTDSYDTTDDTQEKEHGDRYSSYNYKYSAGNGTESSRCAVVDSTHVAAVGGSVGTNQALQPGSQTIYTVIRDEGGFAINIDMNGVTLSRAFEIMAMSATAGGNHYFGIQINTARKLEVFRLDYIASVWTKTVTYTSATALDASGFNGIQMAWLLDTVFGYIKVDLTKSGGTTTEIDASDVITQSPDSLSAGDFPRYVHIMRSQISDANGDGIRYDDLRYCARGAILPGTVLPPSRVAALTPTGTGAYNSSGGPASNVATDPLTSSSSTTEFNALPNVGDKDTYTLSDLPGGATAVYSVNPFFAISNNTNTGFINRGYFLVKVGSDLFKSQVGPVQQPWPTVITTITKNASQTLEDYLGGRHTLLPNPATGVDLSVSDVNGAEAGWEVQANANGPTWIDQVGLEVVHDWSP